VIAFSSSPLASALLIVWSVLSAMAGWWVLRRSRSCTTWFFTSRVYDGNKVVRNGVNEGVNVQEVGKKAQGCPRAQAMRPSQHSSCRVRLQLATSTELIHPFAQFRLACGFFSCGQQPQGKREVVEALALVASLELREARHAFYPTGRRPDDVLVLGATTSL